MHARRANQTAYTQSSTSESSATDEARWPDTPTIPTTATTASSAKRVRASRSLLLLHVRERENRATNPPCLKLSIVCVSSLVVDEIKRIVKSSEIMKEDDSKWPQKNKDGRQELEIRLGTEHISFEVRDHSAALPTSAPPSLSSPFYVL